MLLQKRLLSKKLNRINCSNENKEDLEHLGELAKLKEQVKEKRLQDKIGK